MRLNPFLSAMMLVYTVAAAMPVGAWAQCCSPGNPIGGRSSLGALPRGEGKITATYSHSRSDAYYQGSTVVDPNFVEGGFFHHISLSGAYAVSDRVTVESEVTYFASKVQDYVDGALPASRRGSGLGDWSATINVNLLRDHRTRWELTSGIGLKYPLGTYRQERDGALLPLDVQPTTGAVDFRHSLFLYKGFLETGFRLFAVNHVDVKTANPDGYRYGNLLSTSVFGSFHVGLRWDAALQVRSEIRARDQRQSGPVPVTGSTKLFLSPQLSHAVSQALVVTTLVDIPIYQYYRGAQLGSTIGFSIGLIRRFGLGTLDTDDRPPIFR